MQSVLNLCRCECGQHPVSSQSAKPKLSHQAVKVTSLSKSKPSMSKVNKPILYTHAIPCTSKSTLRNRAQLTFVVYHWSITWGLIVNAIRVLDPQDPGFSYSMTAAF